MSIQGLKAPLSFENDYEHLDEGYFPYLLGELQDFIDNGTQDSGERERALGQGTTAERVGNIIRFVDRHVVSGAITDESFIAAYNALVGKLSET